MEPARLASKQQAATSPTGPRAGPTAKGLLKWRGKFTTLPGGWVSAHFSGRTFLPVRPPPAGDSNLVGFGPILGLWHVEKFRARAENTKRNFPMLGALVGGKPSRPKSLSPKFRSLFTFLRFGRPDPHGREIAKYWSRWGGAEPAKIPFQLCVGTAILLDHN